MQFTNRDPYYQIVRITGPQHNILGVRLRRIPTSGTPEVELLNRHAGAPGALPSDGVVEQVLLGVADGCRETGIHCYVELVAFASDDTPPITVYRALAAEIVRRVAGDGPL
jgi:hypothetical protein